MTSFDFVCSQFHSRNKYAILLALIFLATAWCGDGDKRACATRIPSSKFFPFRDASGYSRSIRCNKPSSISARSSFVPRFPQNFGVLVAFLRCGKFMRSPLFYGNTLAEAGSNYCEVMHSCRPKPKLEKAKKNYQRALEIKNSHKNEASIIRKAKEQREKKLQENLAFIDEVFKDLTPEERTQLEKEEHDYLDGVWVPTSEELALSASSEPLQKKERVQRRHKT